MAAITDLSSASSVGTGDYLVISQSGTDKKVVASKFAIQNNGTWTPTLQFGGATTGITYASRYGFYYTLGSMVVAFGAIELSSKGSASGAATVITLPFASANTSGFYVPIYLQAYQITGGFLQGFVAPGTQVVTLYQLTSGTRYSLTNAEFTNSSAIQFTVIYVS